MSSRYEGHMIGGHIQDDATRINNLTDSVLDLWTIKTKTLNYYHFKKNLDLFCKIFYLEYFVLFLLLKTRSKAIKDGYEKLSPWATVRLAQLYCDN